MKRGTIVRELKKIAAENGGLLLPEIVVARARHQSSPLHSRFEWNNGRAAHAYRLWQARQLISVTVEVLPGTNSEVECFVSLTPDRKQGGYRIMAEVLSDAELRAQMLLDALEELKIFRDKYRRLRELAAIFRAIRRVSKRRS